MRGRWIVNRDQCTVTIRLSADLISLVVEFFQRLPPVPEAGEGEADFLREL